MGDPGIRVVVGWVFALMFLVAFMTAAGDRLRARFEIPKPNNILWALPLDLAWKISLIFFALRGEIQLLPGELGLIFLPCLILLFLHVQALLNREAAAFQFMVYLGALTLLGFVLWLGGKVFLDHRLLLNHQMVLLWVWFGRGHIRPRR